MASAYNFPLMFSFLNLLLLISSSRVVGKAKCKFDSNDLKNNVTRHLYDIESGLKVVMREEEGFDGIQEFQDIHSITHQFLSAKYYEAERSLRKFVVPLMMYSGSNITRSVYIPEVVIDFSSKALMHVEEALPMIHQLAHCRSNVTRNFTGLGGCFVDGTQCQYTHCARGNRLPACSVGFAVGVTGGAAGSYYTVTRPDDNNPKKPQPGTLRHAVEFAGKNKGGAWIVFKESMVIRLKEKLWLHSDTTIDGRGVNVTVFHRGLALARIKNVILHNFEVVSTGDSDTVHVYDGTHLVWIDHLTSKDAYLGLVTVLQGATDVTISNCFLSNHNFNMLLGASDQDTVDQIMRVTVYRNWFESSNQRMPHCRWGYCHVVNNYYRDWHYYAIGGRVHAKILSERNVFEPGEKLEITPWHRHFTADLTPTIESSDDLLLKGATFHQFLSYGTLTEPEDQYPTYRLPVRSTKTLVSLVTGCSGLLHGQRQSDCMTIS